MREHRIFSSLSEGVLDLVTITAFGHLIMGLSAVVLLPLTIGYVGFVGQNDRQLEHSDPDYKDLGEISDIGTQKNSAKNTSQEPYTEVELLD